MADAPIPARIETLTIFVEDLARSKAFYAGAFGLEPLFEDADSVAFRLAGLILNVLVRRAAPELVEPASIAPAGTGPSALLTIPVDDVDAAVGAARAHGIAFLNGPLDRPWGMRTAAFQDPDGYAWELAAPIRDAGAS